VDAVLVWEPWVGEAQKLGNTNIVFSTRDFPGLTYSVLTFRRDFIDAHPREIAALMEVWHRAERYIHDNPDEACQIVAEAFGEPDVNDIRKLMRADRVLDLADNGRAFSYAAGFESLCTALGAA
jgi:NitT/TauT family transport system substrate-binding protein